MLHNNGDIIVVKGLLHKDNNGEIIRDPHGDYRGRPCLIVSDVNEEYHVCTFQSRIINRNHLFNVDPSMIYVYKDKLFNNYASTIRMDWNYMSNLSIYDDFKKVAKMNSKSYLKFLQSFLKYHKYATKEIRIMILEDMKRQEKVLSLKHKTNSIYYH